MANESGFEGLRVHLHRVCVDAYEKKVQMVDAVQPGLMAEVQKFFVLSQTDSLWKEHLQVRVCACVHVRVWVGEGEGASALCTRKLWRCACGERVYRIRCPLKRGGAVRTLQAETLGPLAHTPRPSLPPRPQAIKFLQQAVGLRGYASKDPLTEFKLEGYNLFVDMTAQIRR